MRNMFQTSWDISAYALNIHDVHCTTVLNIQHPAVLQLYSANGTKYFTG